jgi:hypothetical protein
MLITKKRRKITYQLSKRRVLQAAQAAFANQNLGMISIASEML